MTRPLLRALGFLACFDLVATMAASGFLRGYLGPWYVVGQPSTLAMAAMLLHYSLAPLRFDRTLLALAAAFISVGLHEYVATGATGGFQDQALLQLLYGFLYPAMLVLFVAGFSAEKRLLFWRWFYLGLVTYLILGFVLLVVDGIFWAWVKTAGLGAAVITLRYNYQNSLFSLIMGNANKTSNYLMLATLVGPVLLGLRSTWGTGVKSTRDLQLFRLFAVLAIIMMILMFSRIIMLLLLVPIYLNREFLFSTRKGARWATVLTVALVALVYARWFEQINFVVQYLLFSAFLGGEAQGFLGTGTGRFQQWSELGAMLSDPGTLFFGLGYGTYGAMQGCDGCGTHNLFLDHLIASGIYGFAVLLGMNVYGGLKSLLRRDWRLAVTFAVFFLLAIREYSMAYLQVTSMGGVMFMTLFYALRTRPTAAQ